MGNNTSLGTNGSFDTLVSVVKDLEKRVEELEKAIGMKWYGRDDRGVEEES